MSTEQSASTDEDNVMQSKAPEQASWMEIVLPVWLHTVIKKQKKKTTSILKVNKRTTSCHYSFTFTSQTDYEKSNYLLGYFCTVKYSDTVSVNL